MIEEISSVLFYICVYFLPSQQVLCTSRIFHLEVLHKHEPDEYTSITLGYQLFLLLFTSEEAATNYMGFLLLLFIVARLPHVPDDFRAQPKSYG